MNAVVGTVDGITQEFAGNGPSSSGKLRKIPTKLKDPGSFIIPCVVGTNEFPRYLCDLGTSINLMPLSIFRKLGLGDVKATNMTLQLADHSIKRPYGVVDEVLVRTYLSFPLILSF